MDAVKDTALYWTLYWTLNYTDTILESGQWIISSTELDITLYCTEDCTVKKAVYCTADYSDV